MPKVIFVADDGRATTLDVAVGHSMMVAAVAADLPGIVGECGGSANCATCHVYVEGGPIEALPPVGAIEDAMLDSTASERRPSSRLACQIVATEALDGLVLRLPPTQI